MEKPLRRLTHQLRWVTRSNPCSSMGVDRVSHVDVPIPKDVYISASLVTLVPESVRSAPFKSRYTLLRPTFIYLHIFSFHPLKIWILALTSALVTFSIPSSLSLSPYLIIPSGNNIILPQILMIKERYARVVHKGTFMVEGKNCIYLF